MDARALDGGLTLRRLGLLLVLACLLAPASAPAATKYGPLERAGVKAGGATIEGDVLTVAVRVKRRTKLSLAVVTGKRARTVLKATRKKGRHTLSTRLERVPRAGQRPRLQVTARAGGRRGRGRLEIVLKSGNRPPTDIGLSPAAVAENAPATTTVGALSAVDPDAGQTHAFKLVAGAGSEDNARFAVAGGALVTTAPLDFEARPTASVRVAVTDSGGAMFERALTVAVTNLNEAPGALALSRADVDENQPAGATVGSLSSTDPEILDAPTYTLVAGPGSTHNALFAVEGTLLKTAATLDHEAAATRSVRLRVADGKGGTFEQAFTITVNEVNEAPDELELSNDAVSENEPAGAEVGTLSATDPDTGDAIVFSLVPGEGDADNALFAIDGATLRTAAPLDFEQSQIRNVRVRAADGRGGTMELSFTITVIDGPEPATVTTSAGSLAYTEGDPGAAIDPGLTITDQDSANLESATVEIATGLQAEDELVFAAQNGITGAYDAGTLTLTGPATVADFQAALRSVQFHHGGDAPAAARTVEFRVADADGPGPASARNVAITAVNDVAHLTSPSAAAAYTENGAGTAVDPGVAIVDPDSAILTGATVAITDHLDPAQDRLDLPAQNGITAAYDEATGVLTLTGPATRAHYETALQSVKYRNTSDAPSTATRAVSFTVQDGPDASNTLTRDVTVTATNDAPSIPASTTSAVYQENSPPVLVDPSLTVDDPDSATLVGATVEITGGAAAGDALAFTTVPGINGTYLGGTLTLTGTATTIEYQAALRTLTFETTGNSPSSAPRTLQFELDDGTSVGGGTRTVDVVPVDDGPSVTTSAGSASYVEDDAVGVPVDPGVLVADVDSATLTSATVETIANAAAGDTLVFGDQNGISGAFTGGVLTLTGPATPAQYATALASVRFRTAGDDPSTATRTVRFTVTDGTSSAAATRDVTVVATNDAPHAADDAAGTTTEDAALDTTDVRANDTEARPPAPRAAARGAWPRRSSGCGSE